MARSFLVLDLETVPDRDVWEPPETPGGAERTFPPPYAHRIVVAGALWLGDDYALRRAGVFERWQDEAALLGDLSQFMARERPDLVTFNGRSFDLPVIIHRSLRHGVPQPWFYARSDYRYRYSAEGHIDLCDLLAEHGAARAISLDAAARLIGLPGKAGLDGSQVEGLFRAGQIDTLHGYCLSDVIQTAFLFLRARLVMGALELPGYRRVAAALYDALAETPRAKNTLEAADRARLLLIASG